MTNKEKFKEIFGIEPDCGRCNPYPCEENDCKYWAECENQPGCPCDNWWDWEFKEPKAKDVPDNNAGKILDKIRAEIKELHDSYHKDGYHDEADALAFAMKVIDKRKAECEG